LEFADQVRCRSKTADTASGGQPAVVCWVHTHFVESAVSQSLDTGSLLRESPLAEVVSLAVDRNPLGHDAESSKKGAHNFRVTLSTVTPASWPSKGLHLCLGIRLGVVEGVELALTCSYLALGPRP